MSNVRDHIELNHSDVAVRALRDAFYYGSSAQMGRALGILPAQVLHFAAGTSPAPLHLFVRASYATGASMEQIFISNRFDEKTSMGRNLHFEVRRSVPHRLRLGADLVVRLDNALAEGGKQSVGAVAAGLNITAKTVWRHERELSSRLARMHEEFMGRETQAQKEEYKAKAVVFIVACAARGLTPSRRQVDLECGGDGRFSTQWKRLIIREAIAESRHVASTR
ncbi:hypothetical protein AB4Y38_24390 [Paraburkholderia sp. EG285A]|uniref:hypothetical protein n=1 Tax=Paraburkholderia sp. EG285A TaxID=3237009 RepID=UPI0034D1EEA5